MAAVFILKRELERKKFRENGEIHRGMKVLLMVKLREEIHEWGLWQRIRFKMETARVLVLLLRAHDGLQAGTEMMLLRRTWKSGGMMGVSVLDSKGYEYGAGAVAAIMSKKSTAAIREENKDGF
ncbi:hypothetical protein C5167_022603 [Papaver somniferum]|uniref:Uncharacterized protein n=1 Tax=Papaver somniferum TaxID=3469 RepID=A0A4Y7JLD6_PAPSO|nr:hypothetical protein C5167_022603 [Papaver somniferum]